MLVGEIGFPRQEFLHDIKWWEVRSIIRGYNRRHHHGWEQARLVAYNVHYCMGVPQGHNIPTISEWIKFPWEKRDDGEPSDMPDDAEVQRLRQMMIEENARAEAGLPPDGDFTKGSSGAW